MALNTIIEKEFAFHTQIDVDEDFAEEFGDAEEDVDTEEVAEEAS